MKRLLDADGNTISVFHSTPNEGEYIIQHKQDAEPIVYDNMERQKLDTNYSPSRELQKVASVPLVVWEQWRQEGMPMFDKVAQRKFIMKKLAENPKLRTAKGRERFRRGYEPAGKNVW